MSHSELAEVPPAGMEPVASLIESAQAAERAGSWNEALARYEAALSRLPAEGEAARRAELLRWIGRVYRQRGDMEQAASAYASSLAVAEAHGLSDQIAAGLNVLAVVEQLRGSPQAAEEMYLRARALAEEAGDERLAAMVEQNLGMLQNIRGNPEGALLHYQAALACYRRLGDDLSAAWALNNMGMAYVDRGNWRAAELCLDQALELAERVQDADTLGTIELNRAELYLNWRNLERAREACERAFEIFARAESKAKLAETYRFYSVLYREMGKPQLAEAHLAVVLELARSCDDRLLEAEAQNERALLYAAEGRNREALLCLNEAHGIFTMLQARSEVLDIERRLDRLEESYLQVVQAWGDSIESKDRYTAGHCGRVAEYTCLLAKGTGIGGRDLAWLRMGAILHDVGKTAVPAELLNKPGKLTSEEWEVIKRHTVVGDEIVSELHFPWDVRPIVRNHHEHWDGGGYPDGLAGEEIPVAARILCVADVYDALTTERSYRRALSHEEALQIMEREAGKVLDPQLLRVFRRLLEEQGGLGRAAEAVVAMA
ncbi:MAG: tetratricopeptide repeat protein [Gemmatimonadetes bacterium]|nr:tetratricopeptide repeat protein [Gemmatimonadota bacterium]